MKGDLILESGDFVTITGAYSIEYGTLRNREYTLLYGDTVPTFQKKKMKWTLVKAAPHPKRG